MMIMGRRCTWLLATVFTVIAVWAGPRDQQEMRRAAARVLAGNGMINAEEANSIRLMEKYAGLSVMGNDRVFAIIAADDAYPEVLAYSPTPYETAISNPHFNWWVRTTEQALGSVSRNAGSMAKPKSGKHAGFVAPLIRTRWGQGHPFNMYCPKGFPTGCVTTATTQVMKYNEWPKKGQGTVFTYTPFGDFDGTRYEAVLGEYEYPYDLMENYYWEFPSRKVGSEVATLMFHVGLAVKSNYEARGTGAYTETLCNGLRNNFGYPYAVAINRDDYTAEEWIDMVYASISEGKPIIYGGSDDTYTGHEFVLDGYDMDGRIHINWGWEGDGDGFFNLWPLIVFYYDFSYYQDMVVRCSTDCLTADTVVVNVDKPGTLRDLPEVNDSVICLKVRGMINGTDLRTLRTLAGSDAYGHGTHGQLSVLDLSEASIVAGGEPYLTDDGEELTTSDGEMPYKAFSRCSMLIDVRLPEGLKSYGGAVFANCNNLDRVVLHSGEGSDFIVEDGMVLSSDRSRLMECLPVGTQTIQYVIPDGVKEIGAYAFSGRFLYERMVIPECVERIGPFAFNRCFNLVRTYVLGEEPPVIEPSAIDDLDISLRKLYVPEGSKSKYAAADGWKKYSNSIKEFDKTVISEARTDIGREKSRAIYDLQGRIVNMEGHERHLSPGVYVVGGKRMVVR